jgi:lipoate---protein ligase
MDTSSPPSTRWRIEPLVEAAPRTLLDAGLDLLDGLDDDPTPAMRWYRATATAIVLGRGQRPLLPASGIEVLTRFSGGGAVLMDSGLLSCDIALPSDHPLLDGDLSAVFRRIGRGWADALSQLGVPRLHVHDGPSVARRRGTPREQLLAAVCYATVGRGEVVVESGGSQGGFRPPSGSGGSQGGFRPPSGSGSQGGRKLVGLAQRRRRVGALVQCGLLRRWRPGALLAALGADPHDEEIARAAVGLDELGFGDLDDTTIIRAVSRAIAG